MRHVVKTALPILVAVASFLFGADALYAQTNYKWNVGNGGWGTATNWLPNGIPGVGDSVVIDNGSVVTISANLTIGSLKVQNIGSALLLNGNITLSVADNMCLLNGGAVLCQPAGAAANTYVGINVGGDLAIDVSSAIDGDGRGYPPQFGPAGIANFSTTSNSTTNYAGKNFSTVNGGGGGGGHGGSGGAGAGGGGAGGLAYGNAAAPITMGSGGGQGQRTTGQFSPGGAGGAAIRLTINGTLVLEGAIRANGFGGGVTAFGAGDAGGGGGAGGSLYITVGNLMGGGVVSANGGIGGGSGTSTDGGGGGAGGRVVIEYYGGVNILSSVTVNGGVKGLGGAAVNGANGTVSVSNLDASLPDTKILIKPPQFTDSPTAVFTFASNEPGVTFERNLDAGGWIAAQNPESIPGIIPGNHILLVRAKDSAGNVDGTPANYSWTVDNTAPLAPGVVNDGAGADINYQSSATTIASNWATAFSDAESGIASYQWAIGTSPGGTDISPFTYRGLLSNGNKTGLSLTDGMYYVTVRATNGNLPVVKISAGLKHTAILKSDGTVWIWGDNTFGQLGDGTNAGQNVPIQVPLLSGIIDIACGANHTVALKDDGTVWAWGRNGGGQLGNGSFADSNVPVQVGSLVGVINVEAGDNHSIAIRENGTVWTWGANAGRQLGDGTSTDRSSPVLVPGIAGMVAVAGGSDCTIALRGDGTVWTWGSNASGQLGRAGEFSVPGKVPALVSIVAVAGGGSYAMILKNDGTVWAWGNNSNGQLGDGTNVGSSAPVQASGLATIKEIACGGLTSHALRADGTIWSWGKNSLGQIGNNSTLDSWTPVQTNIVTSMIAVAGGVEHAVGIKSDGMIWTWGANGAGQLGDATFADKWNPVVLYDFIGLYIDAGSDGVTVDTVLPDTSIISNPPLLSNLSTATFDFSSSEGSSTFERNLDGGGWVLTSTPENLAGLTNGSHTYQVRAIDPAGNTDGSPASYTWTVDTIAPNTTITTFPPALTSSASATFNFSSSEGGSTFESNLDGGGWSPVVGPDTVSGMSDGLHTYAVRAIDPAGNIDPTPASYNWTVDTTAPAIPLAPDLTPTSDTGVSNTDDITGDTTPTFIGIAEPNSVVELFANWVSVGSTVANASGNYSVTSSSLADGSYDFAVTATDSLGNASSPSPILTVIVDTSPPSPGTVNDGVGADIDFQDSTTMLDANWSAFFDPESVIISNEWAIGTTPGGTDIQGFVSIGALATSASASTLTLSPGITCYITVRATNAVGLTATATSNGVKIALPDAPLNLSAMALNSAIDVMWDPALGAASYYVYYGTSPGSYGGTDAAEGSSPISTSGNFITLTGLANATTYYITVSAVSLAGVEGAKSSEVFATPYSSNTNTFVRNLTGGTTFEFYRMISVPLTPSDPDPLANLSDDLGPYEPINWRLFAYDASSGNYIEVSAPGIAKLLPGEAFWIISRYPATIGVDGTPTDSTSDAIVHLRPGWNMIGHPFDFPVDWADAKANGIRIGDPGENGFISEMLWDWIGSYIDVAQLVPGRGYWVHNLTSSNVDLQIPPISASPGAIAPSAKSSLSSGKGKLYAEKDFPPMPPGAQASSSDGGGGGGGGGCYIAAATTASSMTVLAVRAILIVLSLLIAIFCMRRSRPSPR